ncbi:AbrB/MazE/SpoVT family DNA-binding domain-containing protein [Candidatus Woesearchaeota archaeon]|nr:AbrB/MazE/SpoVT family DNA-binding domain-containing protein [Candidatus Woesearchaeota archaeon]
MKHIIELGTISSRGQIAIPSSVRNKLGLNKGQKIIFFLKDNTLLIRKVDTSTFEEITRPLHKLAEKANFKESDVPHILERFRKRKNGL